VTKSFLSRKPNRNCVNMQRSPHAKPLTRSSTLSSSSCSPMSAVRFYTYERDWRMELKSIWSYRRGITRGCVSESFSIGHACTPRRLGAETTTWNYKRTVQLAVSRRPERVLSAPSVDAVFQD